MNTLLDQCHDQMSAAQLVAHHQAGEVTPRAFDDGPVPLLQPRFWLVIGLAVALWVAVLWVAFS